MGQFICKHNGWYFLYSTIVDAPVTAAMTLDDLRELYRAEYGNEGMRDLESRLARVETKGTSSCVDSGVDDVFTCNRAGLKETHLTVDQCVDWLVACRDNPDLEPPLGLKQDDIED